MSEQTENPENLAPSSSPSEMDAILSEAFARMEADLEGASEAILQDNFASGGIGAIGTYHRSIASLTDQRLADEAWSGLIAFAERLWDTGQQKAALKLLEDARLRLAVPDTFSESLEYHINYWRDYLIFERANARFLEGDDSGARGLISQIENPVARAELEKDLELQSRNRRKSRKKAFTIAGVTMAVSIAAAGVGITSFLDFIHEPHSVHFPDVDWDNALPKFDDNVTFVPEIVDLTQAALASAQASPMPPAEVTGVEPTDTAAPTVDDIFGEDLPSPQSPQSETEAPLGAPEPDAEPEVVDEPNTALTSDISRDCALAFRAAREIFDMAESGAHPGAAAASESFNEMFASACIDELEHEAELSTLAETIPAEEVEAVIREFLP